MRPEGDDWMGVELRGVYDGVSIYLYSDGRIVNRWANDDWKGSTRWASTEDYIEKNSGYLKDLIREQFPPSAPGEEAE